MTPKNESPKTEAGFTLVEMAIVLMIIGLLIAGILRGQELMENARVNAVVQQSKSYDAAVTTFRDIYKALPGDLPLPASRLANCTVAPCNSPGNDDGIIGLLTVTSLTSGAYSPLYTAENRIFWLHMAVTHIISGVDPSSPAVSNLSWGREYPVASIGGGFHVAFVNVPAAPPSQGVSGHFLVLRGDPNRGNIAEGDNVSAISALRAAQIDRKLDDGLPQSGDVIGIGNPNCSGAGTPPIYGYAENKLQRDCNLLIRVQN